MKNMKKYLAEFIGTAVLVIFGCGVAVVTGCEGNGGLVATSLAFGLSIVAMAYSVGNVSGCHINPAVSFGLLVAKRMSVSDFIGYVIAQVLGAAVGSLVLGFFFHGFESLGGNQAQKLLTANYGDKGALFVALAVEVVLTFIFVFAILGVTDKKEHSAFAGLVIGLTLTVVHLLGIRLTGTSVNPARSLAPAVFQAIAGNTEALKEIWIFILGPLVGAALAACVYGLIAKKDNKAEL